MYCVLGFRPVTRMGERVFGSEIEMTPVTGEVDVELPVYGAPHTWSDATQGSPMAEVVPATHRLAGFCIGVI